MSCKPIPSFQDPQNPHPWSLTPPSMAATVLKRGYGFTGYTEYMSEENIETRLSIAYVDGLAPVGAASPPRKENRLNCMILFII